MRRGIFVRWTPAIGVVAIGAIGSFLLLSRAFSPAAPHTGKFDPIRERTIWSDRIEKVGTRNAFLELLAQYKGYSGYAHAVAHIFGEVAYERSGAEAIVACKDSFGFGCFHGLMSRAIGAEGPSVIPVMMHACEGQADISQTGCAHGIGHGLMEFYGASRLSEALEECRTWKQGGPFFGCAGGVFMEYRLPNPADPLSTPSPLPLDPARPYEPCGSDIPSGFKRTCYFGLGTWWDQVYNGNYRVMGELCADLEDPQARSACLEGVGKIAATASNYDIAPTLEKCGEMPDRASEIQCRAGASWSFFATAPSRQALAPRLCEGLARSDLQSCLKEASEISM